MGVPYDTTGSMVLEVGSKFTNETLPNPRHDDLKLEYGQTICAGSWDDGNLYFRLRNSELNSKGACIIEDYIASLVQTIFGVYKPFDPSKGLHSADYEIEEHEQSCPSLTDGSTLSNPSLTPRRHMRLHKRSSISHKAPHTSNADGLMGAKDTSTQGEDYPMEVAEPLPTKTQDLSGSSIIRNDAIGIVDTEVVDSIEIENPSTLKVESPVQLQEVYSPDSQDAETPTDISSEEENEDEDGDEDEDEDEDEYEGDEDPLEDLHQAIRQVLSSNAKLAERVIDYLNKLPSDRQAEIYGFEPVLSRCAGGSRDESSSTPCLDNSKSRKRRRVDASPSDSTQDQVHESNDKENQVLVKRHSPGNQSIQKRYACAFHFFDRNKYGPGSHVGHNATKYKTCGGPGFENLNHYKRHLGRKHVLHQCSRCGEIFNKPGDLQVHLAQDQRCGITEFEPGDGMPQQKWEGVQALLASKNGISDDKERWFSVWDALFPGVPRPPEPYYGAPYPVVFPRIRAIFDALISEDPQVSQDRILHGNMMRALDAAVQAATQSAPSELEVNDPNASLTPAQAPMLNFALPVPTLNADQGDDQQEHLRSLTPTAEPMPPPITGSAEDYTENNIDAGADEQSLDNFNFYLAFLRET